MHDSSAIAQYVVARLGGTPVANSSEYNCPCLSCGKETGLFVNVDKGLAHCFKCEYKANLLRLVMDVEGIDYATAHSKRADLLGGVGDALEPTAKSLDDLYALLLGLKKATQVEDMRLPNGAVPITESGCDQGRRYLRKRMIKNYSAHSLHYVREWDDEEPRYFRHIVFPEYTSDGKLSYWTTRAAYEPKGKAPKSYHPTGVKKETLIGLSVASKRRYCFLVEGPFDMLAFSGRGVAALGKKLTQGQAVALAHNFQTVFVCFDAEARRDTDAAADCLRDCCVPNVYVTRLPWSDPCDALQQVTPKRLIATALACSARAQRRLF